MISRALGAIAILLAWSAAVSASPLFFGSTGGPASTVDLGAPQPYNTLAPVAPVAPVNEFQYASASDPGQDPDAGSFAGFGDYNHGTALFLTDEAARVPTPEPAAVCLLGPALVIALLAACRQRVRS